MLELALALAIAATSGVAPPAAAPSRSVLRAPRATPPSLTPGALALELREANRRRFEELADIQRERARLEQLAAEIAAARRELARESALLDEKTAKLQELSSQQRPATTPPPAPEPAALPADAQAQALARTLKGMKPDQAAALIGRLEKPLAVAVLAKLRPADAAGVLGRMPSSNAAELFTLMARHGGSPR